VDSDEKEVMPTQIALRFDEVPITCPTQQRYHAIAPCLAGHCSPADIARHLDVSYATGARWLREFRDNREGMLVAALGCGAHIPISRRLSAGFAAAAPQSGADGE
jgi:hypothetical protein